MRIANTGYKLNDKTLNAIKIYFKEKNIPNVNIDSIFDNGHEYHIEIYKNGFRYISNISKRELKLIQILN